NLLGNAVKYTGHHGRITVSLTLAAESGFVQMAVSDNGVGIPESDQGRIFNRFFRGENAHLTGETGAGLGLHITRGLVELHSGHIWLQSQLGQGSTFFVTFPIADEEPT
ncbi:MAG: ATP-binding protein, partial [Anaerolineae bacterium]